MTENEKMAAFGRMVLGMMTDVLVLPEGEAYARKTVTMPDGRGGKHSLELIVARKGVADAMDMVARAQFSVLDVKTGPEGKKQ